MNPPDQLPGTGAAAQGTGLGVLFLVGTGTGVFLPDGTGTGVPVADGTGTGLLTLVGSGVGVRAPWAPGPRAVEDPLARARAAAPEISEGRRTL